MGVLLHSSCDSPSRSLHKGKTKVMSMTHVAKQEPVCWIDEQLLEKGRFKADDEVATNLCRGTGHLAGVEVTDGFALRISPE